MKKYAVMMMVMGWMSSLAFGVMPASPSSMVAPVPKAAPSSMVTQSKYMTTGAGQMMDSVAAVSVKNRAATLGNGVSGSGTLYRYVTDQDVANARDSKALMELLSPKVNAGDGIRKVEMVVDLRRALSLNVPKGSTVNIGTVRVDPMVRQLEANALVSMPELRAVGR